METTSDVRRIFVYLREIQKLNEKIIRTVASYDKVIWLSEGIPTKMDLDFIKILLFMMVGLR